MSESNHTLESTMDHAIQTCIIAGKNPKETLAWFKQHNILTRKGTLPALNYISSRFYTIKRHLDKKPQEMKLKITPLSLERRVVQFVLNQQSTAEEKLNLIKRIACE